MIARSLLWVFVLLLAGVATVAQLDHQSRISPGLAFAIPQGLGGSAARERSKINLQAGNTDAALADAEVQLSRRPMPAESLTILALTSLAAGDIDRGRSALSAASRRGWREPISQLASGQSALSQAEFRIAAQRVTALLSSGQLTDQALALLGDLVETPAGQEAFAERLAAYGRWQDNALVPAFEASDPAAWARTMALAQKLDAQFGCDRLRALAAQYRRSGRGELVASFDTAACKLD